MSQPTATTTPVSPTTSAAPPDASELPWECEECHQRFKTELGLNGHKKHHEKEERTRQEEERSKELERKKNRAEPEIYADIKMRGREAMEEVLRIRLEDDLISPGIPVVSRQKALREWDSDATIRSDMNALYTMLSEDAGIEKDKARRIVQKINQVYAKFQGALYESGEQPFFQQGMFGPQNRAPNWNPTWGNPQNPSQSPYQAMDVWGRPINTPSYPADPWWRYPPDRSLTREDVTRLIDDRISPKFEELKKLIESNKPVAPVSDRRMVKFSDGTAIEASPSMSDFLLWKKLEDKPEPGKPVGESIGEAIDKVKEELTAPLQRKLTELDEKLNLEKEARHQEEVKRLESEKARGAEDLKRMETRIDTIQANARSDVAAARASATAGGYRGDEYRLVSEGLHEVAEVAKTVKPVDKVIDFATKLMGGGQGEQQVVTATTQQPELNELEQQGLVTQQ